jgi:hypothetical protein
MVTPIPAVITAVAPAAGSVIPIASWPPTVPAAVASVVTIYKFFALSIVLLIITIATASLIMPLREGCPRCNQRDQ